MDQTGCAHLVRLSDRQTFSLIERLTTIGSSKRSKIRINNVNVPSHCAYILFNSGSYFLHPVENTFQLLCNGKAVLEPIELMSSSILQFGKDTFLFEKTDYSVMSENGSSAVYKLVGAINAFFRNISPEARFEMLNSISQALKCDGARMVVEDQTSGAFTTIARFPKASNLDRFSERALIWAKQQKKAVLMNATQWQAEKLQGSLELNNIGSIICMPIICNQVIRGYLYLDRLNTQSPFGREDWEICDALSPIIGDIMALYEKSVVQQKTIESLQKVDGTGSKPVLFCCDRMIKIINTACNFARTDSTILLQGETGTGKEVIARLIHNSSKRSEKPFVVINCGAIPENLIESELFGHQKGAFTGASTRKEGLFEAADGGSLFLDEIGELPLNLQVKLLRVLQESEVLPLGATVPVVVNTRVIAATNRNLMEEAEKNNFRKDLYYRLNVLKIEIPPLRERGNDVLLIASYFINKYSSQFGISPKQLTLTAQSVLIKHNWPGNIRELENVIQKAVLVARGTLIEPHDLDIDNGADKSTVDETMLIVSLKQARERAEKNAIISALNLSKGNITVAANLLQTDRKWLTRLVKEYGINRNGEEL